MPIKSETVLNDVKSGKYAPIYFLQGEEPYFIDLISDYIEKHAIPEQDKSFNQTIMYGKDAPLSAILNNARRFPMMADRQLVIVKEAQNIPDLSSEGGEALLLNYIHNPLPSTILVFCYKYKTLDGKRKLAKEMDKWAVVVKSEKVPEWKISPWIEEYISEKGHKIDMRTATFLAESIGNNLEVLTNEIGKMLINFNEATAIDTTHIQRYIGINKDYNNFELTKAIGIRNVLKANKIINYFVQNSKAHPVILLIPFIYSFFVKIALVHGNPGLSDNEIAYTIGVNPYFVKEYKSASRHYQLGKVIDCLGFIKEADLRSKGVNSEMEDSEILKELIFKIMH